MAKAIVHVVMINVGESGLAKVVLADGSVVETVPQIREAAIHLVNDYFRGGLYSVGTKVHFYMSDMSNRDSLPQKPIFVMDHNGTHDYEWSNSQGVDQFQPDSFHHFVRLACSRFRN